MAKEYDQDKLLRAYSLLTSLHQNISDPSISEYNSVSQDHINQFNTILNTISSIGIETSDFIIPEHEIKPQLLSSHMDGSKTYSDERYIRKSLFLTRLQGLITYLGELLKPPPRKVGF